VEVVVAVSVAVCAVVLVIETEVGERLHPVALTAPVGEVTAQVSVTVPVNEFAGVTVMVEVPEDPALTAMLPLLVSVKLVPLFGACQKSPQPATRGAAANNNLAHLPILIAAPSMQLFHRRCFIAHRTVPLTEPAAPPAQVHPGSRVSPSRGGCLAWPSHTQSCGPSGSALVDAI